MLDASALFEVSWDIWRLDGPSKEGRLLECDGLDCGAKDCAVLGPLGEHCGSFLWPLAERHSCVLYRQVSPSPPSPPSVDFPTDMVGG